MASDWSAKWNALPDDVRRIGSMVEAQMRIQQLGMELDRLKSRYRQSVREVKSHIANLEESLRRGGESEVKS